jgi:hypothetical protein
MSHSVRINLRKNFVSSSLFLAFLILALFGGADASHGAHDPWLLSFGDISTDSAHVYFVGDTWVGYYLAPRRLMFMAPRDSMTVPPSLPVSDSLAIGSAVFAAKGAALIKREQGRKPQVRKLPKPDARTLKYLSARQSSGTYRTKSVRETIHPLTGFGERIWFGLELADTSTNACVAGLGWFDTTHSRFELIFDSSLVGYAPKWIGVAADTVNVLYVGTNNNEPQSKLMRYAIRAGTLSAFDVARLRLTNESVHSAAVWGDTLLLTTDTNIIIWWPHAPPEMWSTWMYAAPQPAPLYLVNFSTDSATFHQDTVRIRVLRYGEPVEVRMWHGDYAEIVTSDDINGYIDDADWRAHQNLWSERDWNCGDSLCFARVRLLRGGHLVDGQVIHVPISYVGKDDNGIRVSFQAAWVRREDLLPVLLPR